MLELFDYGLASVACKGGRGGERVNGPYGTLGQTGYALDINHFRILSFFGLSEKES